MCELLEHFKRSYLLGKLLALTNYLKGHRGYRSILLELLVLYKTVYAIESNSSVVTDNSSSAVCIGKTGYNVVGTALSHLGSVCVKNARVVSFSMLGEEINNFGVYRISVVTARLNCHTDSSCGHKRAF